MTLKVIGKGLRDFGRPTKLSRADQLLLSMMYWREYRTEFHIAQSYGTAESTVYRTIQKIENALVRSGKFRLPGKKAFQASDTVFKVVLVDVSEQSVERPKKTGITAKKRRHTQKTQVITDRKSVQFVATAFSHGSKHDFQMMVAILPNTFASWQTRATKDWRICMKTVRRLLRNQNFML